MILGGSLQVMASLTEREGLRGKVQCVCMREEIDAVLAEVHQQS